MSVTFPLGTYLSPVQKPFQKFQRTWCSECQLFIWSLFFAHTRWDLIYPPSSLFVSVFKNLELVTVSYSRKMDIWITCILDVSLSIRTPLIAEFEFLKHFLVKYSIKLISSNIIETPFEMLLIDFCGRYDTVNKLSHQSFICVGDTIYEFSGRFFGQSQWVRTSITPLPSISLVTLHTLSVG